MGRCHSKISEPNNPFEMEKYKREMYERKYRECEKQLKRCKKSDEKVKRDTATSNRTSHQQMPTQSSTTRPKQFTESDYDMEAKNRMQDQLAYDSQTFVLNQLMLAVQFYGNFEKYSRLHRPPHTHTFAISNKFLFFSSSSWQRNARGGRTKSQTGERTNQ